jgi:hypothetical protein
LKIDMPLISMMKMLNALIQCQMRTGSFVR